MLKAKNSNGKGKSQAKVLASLDMFQVDDFKYAIDLSNPYYRTYNNMVLRVKRSKGLVGICPEWDRSLPKQQGFRNFADWCDTQIGCDFSNLARNVAKEAKGLVVGGSKGRYVGHGEVQGGKIPKATIPSFSNSNSTYQLDKDVLSTILGKGRVGHGEYSPETCCFLPAVVNVMLRRTKRSESLVIDAEGREFTTTLPHGIHQGGKHFYSFLHGKRMRKFESAEEASCHYQVEKAKYNLMRLEGLSGVVGQVNPVVVGWLIEECQKVLDSNGSYKFNSDGLVG